MYMRIADVSRVSPRVRSMSEQISCIERSSRAAISRSASHKSGSSRTLVRLPLTFTFRVTRGDARTTITPTYCCRHGAGTVV